MKKYLLVLTLLLFAGSVYGQSGDYNPPGAVPLPWMSQSAAPTAPAVLKNFSFAGTGLNDISYDVSSYSALSRATFTITLTAGTPDTFSWTETGGSAGSGSNVSITGSSQSLADAVTISFNGTTGHHSGDVATIKVIPQAIPYINNAGQMGVIWSNGSTWNSGASGGPSGVAGTAGKVLINGGTSAVTSGTATVSIGTDVPLLDGTAAYNNFSNGITFDRAALLNWKDGGGTPQTVISIDNSNNLIISGLPTGSNTLIQNGNAGGSLLFYITSTPLVVGSTGNGWQFYVPFSPQALNNTQRDALTPGSNHAVIWSTTDSAMEYWDGAVWKQFSHN